MYESFSKEWAEKTKQGTTFKFYVSKGYSELEALQMIWEVKQEWEAANSKVVA